MNRLANGAVALAALTAASCSRTTTSQTNVPQAPRTTERRTATSDIFQRQASNAVDLGDGDVRTEVLRKALLADPMNLKVRMELASHYEQAGFPEIAVEHYRLGIAQYPNHAGVHVALARGLHRQSADAEAIAMLEEFGNRTGGTVETFSWLGILRDKTGDYPGGERDHRKALSFNTGRDYLHNNLGYNLMLQGHYAEAAAEFRKALALAPDSTIARNNLGIALQRGGSPDAAREFRAAAGSSAAHNNVAATLIEQGRLDAARAELGAALKKNPNDTTALHNLALVQQRDGRALPVPKQKAGFWKRVVRTLDYMFVSGDYGEPSAAKRDQAKQSQPKRVQTALDLSGATSPDSRKEASSLSAIPSVRNEE